jgi:hypothetical protein
MPRTSRHHDTARASRGPGGRLDLALAAVLAMLAAGSPAAAVLAPAGPAHAFDSDLGCVAEAAVDLAPVPGGFVAAWAEDGGLFVQELDLAGVPRGAATQIGGAAVAPRVEALPGGGYVVAWLDPDAESIRLRRRVHGQLGPALDLGDASNQHSPFGGLDIAVTPAGNIAVVWAADAAVELREVSGSGALVGAAPYTVTAYGSILGSEPWMLDPQVLVAADGTLRVFWVAGNIFFGTEDASGTIEGSAIQRVPTGYVDVRELGGVDVGSGLEAAMAPDGHYLLTWVSQEVIADPPPVAGAPYLRARVFGTDDVAGPPMQGDDPATLWSSLGGVAAEALPGGGWLLAWHGSEHELTPQLPRVYARHLDANGNPLGAPITVSDGGGRLPALEVGHAGTVLAAWEEVSDTFTPPACQGAPQRLLARPLGVGCGAPGAFCVDGGRFSVSLEYGEPGRGPAGIGNGVALTRDSGYFWFFSPDNAEVIVKVLDGRGVNGAYWVFYGGLTDLGFRLTVTDVLTGRVRTFEQPRGQLASRGVTDAFPAATSPLVVDPYALRVAGLERMAFPGDDRSSELGVAAAPSRAVAELDGIPPCSPLDLPAPPGPGLCLEGRRFNVTATWSANGQSGVGQGVSLGDDSGYFWFFSPDNIELVVKVLDGRAVNGHFWAFYGALSNVEYDLGVEHVFGSDADVGADGIATYHNAAGNFSSRADTEALLPPSDFACPAVLAPVCGVDGRTYANSCEARYGGWVDVAHIGACP